MYVICALSLVIRQLLNKTSTFLRLVGISLALRFSAILGMFPIPREPGKFNCMQCHLETAFTRH